MLVKTQICWAKRSTIVVGHLLLLLLLHRQLLPYEKMRYASGLSSSSLTNHSVSRTYNMNTKRSTIFSLRSNTRTVLMIDTFSTILFLSSEWSTATNKFYKCVERVMKCTYSYSQQQRSYCWMIKMNTPCDLPYMPCSYLYTSHHILIYFLTYAVVKKSYKIALRYVMLLYCANTNKND